MKKIIYEQLNHLLIKLGQSIILVWDHLHVGVGQSAIDEKKSTLHTEKFLSEVSHQCQLQSTQADAK